MLAEINSIKGLDNVKEIFQIMGKKTRGGIFEKTGKTGGTTSIY